MFKPPALGNAFAATTLAFYIVFYLLRIFAPPFGKLILNSQFLGADIASQVPKPSVVGLLGNLIAVALVSWISGYLIAWFYNRFTKNL